MKRMDDAEYSAMLERGTMAQALAAVNAEARRARAAEAIALTTLADMADPLPYRSDLALRKMAAEALDAIHNLEGQG